MTKFTAPVIVLGAGPSGLAAAFKLAERGWRDVTVLERSRTVGGNAGSFTIDGIPVDYGSHRLHPACSPEVMSDIRRLLGDDLLDRPRNGRIRLRGRWLRFPLRPVDLLTRLPPSFIAGVARDAVRPRGRHVGEESFASVLDRGLGPTICRDFYFPYADKIWGLPPAALDAEQARRRVSSGSIRKMVHRVLRGGSAKGTSTGRRFFYPRHGYGQISEALRIAAVGAGARVLTETTVVAVRAPRDRVSHVDVVIEGQGRALPAAAVLSTIPLTALARLVHADTAAPAAGPLRQRSMVLVYLTLGVDAFTPFDAHYFPEKAIRISRLSEPKHYSLTTRAARTVLCAELPCALDGPEWTMTDEALRGLVVADLERAGLGPVPEVLGVQTRRLPQAYPIYERGYRHAFETLDQWVSGIDGLVTFGRQGLFAHDNTHHTMAMAYAAVDCLRDDGLLDRERWASARRSFEDHVVED